MRDHQMEEMEEMEREERDWEIEQAVKHSWMQYGTALNDELIKVATENKKLRGYLILSFCLGAAIAMVTMIVMMEVCGA